MKTLEQFKASKPFGFVTEKDMPELIAIDRFAQCLVRAGAGRLVCSAQDVPWAIKNIEAGGDYVRDVSLYTPYSERHAAAATAAPDPIQRELDALTESLHALRNLKPHSEDLRIAARAVIACEAAIYKLRLGVIQRNPSRKAREFDERDCSGVFDGISTVTSDADPGL